MVEPLLAQECFQACGKPSLPNKKITDSVLVHISRCNKFYIYSWQLVMKFIRCLSLIVIIHQFSVINCNAQSGDWIWMAGDTVPPNLTDATFGTKYFASNTNNPTRPRL